MPIVRSLPDQIDAVAAPGQSLLEALLAAKVPVTHACGGKARCSTCRVRVLEGLAACSARTAEEQTMADQLGLEGAIRLACQTRTTADLVVRRLVLDPEDYELTRQFTQRTTRAASGREAPVAVLFADIAGFTALSEALPAYDVVHVLHRWFHRASQIVEAHGGSVDNYMGDGFLAVFGTDGSAAPGPGGAAKSAVVAALALLEEAERMSAYLTTAYERTFRVRLGVHHGPVVVGSPTPWDRARDTVIGDVVNFASRIEAANKELGSRLLISDAVLAHVQGQVRLGRRLELAIRGKSGVHTLHEVLGLRPG